MSVSSFPMASYSFSKDFDYRSWLEERSHAEYVAFRTDESIQQLIGSQSEIAERIGQGAEVIAGTISDQIRESSMAVEARLEGIEGQMGQIDDTLREGFVGVGIRIGELSDSVENQTVIIDRGFKALEWRIEKKIRS